MPVTAPLKSQEEATRMLLSTLHAQYLEKVKIMQTLSPDTQCNYMTRCKRFIAYLSAQIGKPASVADLNQLHVTGFLLTIARDHPKSVPITKYALMHFARWLIKERWLADAFVIDFDLPKTEPTRRHGVPDDSIPALLLACERLPFTEYRCTLARAVISTLAHAGLRISELCALKLEDVDIIKPPFLLRIWNGKGRKHRTVILCKEAIDDLRRYHAIRPKCDLEDFFVQNTMQHVGHRGVRYFLQVALKGAGIEGDYTPHCLRHTKITHDLLAGKPPMIVMSEAGHNSFATTQGYMGEVSDKNKAQYAHLSGYGAVSPPPAPMEPKKRKADEIERRRSVRVRK